MLNRQTQSTILQCTHCHETMQLVRHIDITELPEIFVFYCSACQRAETVKQDRAAWDCGRARQR